MADKVPRSLIGLRQIVNQEAHIPLVELNDETILSVLHCERIATICGRRFIDTTTMLPRVSETSFGEIRRELGLCDDREAERV